MQINSIVVCSGDDGDWIGIFVNDELEYEGHDIPTHIWLKTIDKYRVFSRTSEYEISHEYLESIGNFPSNFSEIPKEFLNEY